jgi:predicted permease
MLMAATRNLANPIPAYIVFDLDKTVLGFVVLATIVAALVSGLIPAWMASSANANDALKDSGRGNTGRVVGIIMKGLVVFQILVTCLLLIGSLLQLKSIIKQGEIDYGYDTQAVLTARMGLMDGDYPTSESRKLFYDRIALELENHPEIAEASITTRFQMVFSGNGPVEIEGKEYKEDRDRPNANFENISPGYFETLGMQLRQGRDFNADDTDQKLPVAIVNAGFTAKHFGNEDAVGRRFRTVGNNGTVFGPWRTIIGVVSNVRMTGPFNQGQNVDETGFYVPFYSTIFGPALEQPQAPQFATVVIKPQGGMRADTMGAMLRREVNKVDPNLPLYFVATPKQNQDGFLGQNKIIATMFSIFGTVAVILSAAGLYGVMSFAVNQRTQEFGIRMALGANAQKILSMVMKQGFVQLGLGLFLGLGVALLFAFLGGAAISQQLFDVSPRDPIVYAGVALLITAVAAFSTWFPARRATRVDPMHALRAE